MRKFSLNKTMMIVAGASAIVVGVSVVAGAFAYRIYAKQDDRPFVRTVAAWAHLPAAKVGSRWVSYVEYLRHIDALKKFLNGSVAREQGLPLTPDASMKKQALDRLMRVDAVEEFAAERGIAVSSADTDRAYDELIARAGTSTSVGEVESFLRDQFGWNAADFKQNVIRPAMLEDGLRKKKEAETKDAEAFETELQARLSKDDVKRFVRFE